MADSMVPRCGRCGELAKWCHLNSEGHCEECSVICQVCEEPARNVGDLTTVEIWNGGSVDMCPECLSNHKASEGP